MAGLNRRRKQRAQAEAELQYGPQADNLALALQDARDTRDTTIRGARGTAAAQISAARHASPALRHALAGPAATIESTYGGLAGDLAALPGNGGTTAGGAARDKAATSAILADILSSGMAENIARARDAKAGRAFAVSNARSAFATARSRIRAQQGSLARQRGLYTTTQYDDLTDAANARADRRAANREKARHDRAQEGISQQNADTAAAKERRQARDANKPKKATGPQVDKYTAAYNSAFNDAKRIAAARGPGSRAYAKQQLASGRPSQTLKNGPDGNPLPNPVTVPGVKQVKSQAIAAAALDMAYRGFVSQNTIRMLKAIGVTPAQLGLRTTPKVAPPLPRPPRLPSGSGALVPGSGGLGGFQAPRLH